jgi:succinate dehydrogenase / fumarate reductase cytochrome b subunit
MLKQRPVYLNLVRIRLPLPGIVSILHRASGALLFLAGIPLLLAAVAGSLASADSYGEWKAAFAHPLAKLVLIGFLWAYLHHFCAGIRYLLLDTLTGIELAPARRSSVVVLAVSLALTAMIGVRLW